MLRSGGSDRKDRVKGEPVSRSVPGIKSLAGVAASQVISNVPAELLLSGFTEGLPALIIGVNLGGPGTLIASMASRISCKLIVREESQTKGAYFLYFAVANACFLAILLVFALTLEGRIWRNRLRINGLCDNMGVARDMIRLKSGGNPDDD